MSPVPPRLSVIVPVYDVETYLPACLDSLAAQTLREIEVIVVDDGSPDGSALIAEEYARRDGRFRLVQQENQGLGAARNTGIDAAHPASEFLAFVDSDDMVPADAYRLMLASLDASGSDFATGNVRHINSRRVWQSPMHRFLGAGAEQRTHVTRKRKLLTDRIACNKVFRKDFWNRHGLRFPVGVLYEDTPVIVPAQFLAEAVDIVSEPVYYWRMREGEAGPSITQRRTEPKAVRDRAAAVTQVSRFLAGRPEPEAAPLRAAFDRNVLMSDLWAFLKVLPEGDAAYRAAFVRAANAFLDCVDPRTVHRLPTQARIKWLLVRKHETEALLGILAEEREGGRGRVHGRLRKYVSYATAPATGGPLPRRVHRIDRDLHLFATLKELSWENGGLRLTGHAWIDRIDQPGPFSAVKALALAEEGTGRKLVLPTRNVRQPEATALSGRKQHNYDWSGFSHLIDPARLRPAGGWRESVWKVGIVTASGGLVRRRGLAAKGPDSPGNPPYQWLDEDYRLLPYSERGVLRLRVERVHALVTGHRALGDDAVEIAGTLRRPMGEGDRLVLRLTNRRTGEIHDHGAEVRPGGAHTDFTVRVPLDAVGLLPGTGAAETGETAEAGQEREDARAAADASRGTATADADLRPVPARENGKPDAPAGTPGPAAASALLAARRTWSTSLVVIPAKGPRRHYSTVVRDGLDDLQVRLPARLAPGAENYEVALLSGNNGYLKIVGRALQARLTDVTWQDDAYTLRGSAPLDLEGAAFVVTARDRFEEHTGEVRALPGGRFQARFTPSRMSGFRGQLPLASGRWNLFLRVPGHPLDVPFTIDRLAVPAFPVEGAADGRTFALQARWHDFPQLNCPSGLRTEERGVYHQARLRRDVYEAGRARPLRDAVLFISYNGKQYSDSPRAVHEELVRRGSDLEQLWLVRDDQAALPPTARKVRLWSEEWYDALARARYIVTNAHLPHWIERRPGQVIVQTWHGTMLKKIGLDIEAPAFNPEYHEQLRAESKNWSLLVSANRFSTPILTRAMGFDGEILETGYPRNDVLYAPDHPERAKEIRESLGLPPGKRVVLYAPTWRDDDAHSQGRFRFDLKLDTERAREELGHDHVLLVRRHSNTVDGVAGAGDGFVFDVSEYPDIADLYLAADVLVTDYSSVMFDYAHLRRPMVFFTYDLEHYRDTLRGFYFDFERNAPGPLVRTTEELLSALRNIDRVVADYSERYQLFHEEFCDLDDGNASARVVDRMLAEGTAGRAGAEGA
ncbi:bifunctional glycosyltransferase/CDP-glycerol:glycerophosphate glycerophosphotransferase [Streptomyces sp. P6-2-1]|uniref:bifunctional glycosyltransferase/CDP-glycerol:glycerophosphate glycerophosphotransferase n=1 Tax=Streptomyces sp. P6-2-1 TaxID=3422591 RepID=UPI003D35B8F2